MNQTSSPAQDEQEILRLERLTMAAIGKKDAEALRRILADDFVYRAPGGTESEREEFLKNISSIPFEILSVRGEELRVNVYGETAVLTGVQKATVADGDIAEMVSAVAFTDVFVRRGGRWQMVLAHGVELPAAQAEAAKPESEPEKGD